jgi:prolyl oligopeptidase
LQHAQSSAVSDPGSASAPVLTRIEVNTGHGFGKPAAMVASEWADLLAFAAHHVGLVPPEQ